MIIPEANSGSGLGMLPAWQESKARNKKEATQEAQVEGTTVHVSNLMDLGHLKIFELDKKIPSYQGPVVPRGDAVKDDSGSYAVFTDEGSSASNMTAADVLEEM